MQQRIVIVGIGMGQKDQMTHKVYQHLKEATLVVGAERMLACYRALQIEDGTSNLMNAYLPPQVCKAVAAHEGQCVVILMSGDSGFYSGTKKLLEALEVLKEDLHGQREVTIEVVPGLSSIAYFAAKLKVSWEDAKLMSLHGKKANIFLALQKHQKLFLLVDEHFEAICRTLKEAGYGDVPLVIGQNLGYPEEMIWKGTIGTYNLQGGLQVACILQEKKVRRPQFGLPDEAFDRGKVPLTKSEVRAVSMSKLCLGAEDIVYDIGAGTGSVAIEMALVAYQGHVYAVECNPEGVALIHQNKEKFGCTNLTVVEGLAPDVLESLPAPDVVFIGGSKGRLQDILRTLSQKKAEIRIVLTAVTTETLMEMMQCVKHYKLLNPDMSQISVTRLQPVGAYHMFQAQNPIFILAADLVAEECGQEGV